MVLPVLEAKSLVGTHRKMVYTRNAAFVEESAEVEVLFAEAAKFDSISKRIKASLGRLESGAQIVQDAMGPVYSNTQDLQTMNGSMDRLGPFWVSMRG